uniref:hypothetical protein n=1 Tax=Caldimonas tepidiphila TaxID=2315841 RepID=UPI0013002946
PSAPPAAVLATALVALFGPVFGEYLLIVFAALAGAMWPLSSMRTPTVWDGTKLVVRLVLTASVLGSFAAGIPSQFAPAVGAWCIGALGDRWKDLIKLGFDRLRGKAGDPA